MKNKNTNHENQAKIKINKAEFIEFARKNRKKNKEFYDSLGNE